MRGRFPPIRIGSDRRPSRGLSNFADLLGGYPNPHDGLVNAIDELRTCRPFSRTCGGILLFGRRGGRNFARFATLSPYTHIAFNVLFSVIPFKSK